MRVRELGGDVGDGAGGEVEGHHGGVQALAAHFLLAGAGDQHQLLGRAALHQQTLPVGCETEVVQKTGRHQHGQVPAAQGQQRPGPRRLRRPERIGDGGVGPQPRAPGFGRRGQGIDRAGAEQQVAGRGGWDGVERARGRGECPQFASRPAVDLLLGGRVGLRSGAPAAEEHDLIEGRALRVGEGPAAQAAVVGGEEAGGDRQALAGHDKDEHAVLRQVAGAMAQEAVLAPLLFPIVVIGRVQEQQAEGAVGDGGGEEVGGQGVVQAGGGLRGPLLVQLHAEGFERER